MQTKKLPNYLRTYRKRAGLNQRELAFLLGCERETTVGRYESGQHFPNWERLLGYQIIFAVPLDQLYVGLYEKVEQRIKQRAVKLIEQLVLQPADALANQKLEFLKQLVLREHESSPGH